MSKKINPKTFFEGVRKFNSCEELNHELNLNFKFDSRSFSNHDFEQLTKRGVTFIWPKSFGQNHYGDEYYLVGYVLLDLPFECDDDLNDECVENFLSAFNNQILFMYVYSEYIYIVWPVLNYDGLLQIDEYQIQDLNGFDYDNFDNLIAKQKRFIEQLGTKDQIDGIIAI